MPHAPIGDDGCCSVKTTTVFHIIALISHTAILATIIIVPVVEDGGTAFEAYHTQSTWNDNTTQLVPEYESHGTFPVVPLAITWTTLSIIHHIIMIVGTTCCVERPWMQTIRDGHNPVRWIEYTLSAAFMAIVIAYFFGISDAIALVFVFMVAAVVNIFGWISERAWPRHHGEIPGDKWLSIAALVLGFDFLLGGWIAYWVQFAINDDGSVPDWIYALIIVENLLYASFGIAFVAVQMVHKDDPRLFVAQEITYTVLSIAAKTTLSLILVFPAAVSF